MQKEKKATSGISIKVIGGVSAIIATLISILLFISLFQLSGKFNRVQKSTSDYMSWKQTALDVKDASDYLTDQVRYYVYNNNKMYMDNYFEEVKVNQRRDKAIAVIEEYLPDTAALNGIKAAVKKSNELMEDEYYAMRLVVDANHITMDDTYPQEIKGVVITDADNLLSDNEKKSLALDYVIGEKYLLDKEYIIDKVNIAVSEIDTMMEKEVIYSTMELKNILIIQQILIGVNIVIIGAIILVLYLFMIRPLDHAIERLKVREKMEERGVKEYSYLASVYNEVREQTNLTKEKLLYEAEHDKLTGLFNRTGYDSIYRRSKLEKCYYILIDVDYFKNVNDKYGHEIGDKVLMKIADLLKRVFSLDNEYVFRLGGDEFSVLVINNENVTINDMKNKCQQVADLNEKERKKLPLVTLSFGIAKGDEMDTTDSLFKKADLALYKIKNNGRHDIGIYDE